MQTVLIQERLHFERHGADVGPLHAGARIQIDAQLVWMVEIPGSYWMRMQLHAAQIDDPGQAGGVVDHDLFGCPAGRKGERDGA